MPEPHDWPFEQPARGTLRPWYLTAAGYLTVLFSDRQEAQRAQRGLLEWGMPENDTRLYQAEEILRITSRQQQERSILAKTIAALVADREARQRDTLVTHRQGARPCGCLLLQRTAPINSSGSWPTTTMDPCATTATKA
jgi:hypothetical protein